MHRHTSPLVNENPAPHTTSTANLPASSSPAPAAPAQYETVFTNAKAGMDNADLAKVKQVVYEMSKDSAHFQNEQRKMQQTEEKIARFKATAASLSSSELAAKAAAMDARIAELEATRDLTRTWIHVDMDAFFAAVEELSNPTLQGKPFAVGGIGMISTASYAARAYGVRSAMPGFIALKLCPELIFVPHNFENYRKASEITRKVFSEYDPHFESASLDEAALDVTDVCAKHKGVSGAEIAEQIREKVRIATGGLTCSCGVAPNRTLAKICSDRNKPNGQYILESSKIAVEAFVHDLPVRKMPGVGRVTEHVLRAFGIEKCGDILRHRGLLAVLFSPISMEFFLNCGLGLGSTHHGDGVAEGEVGRKGISTERTFRPISARSELEAKCRELAENLAGDMAQENLRGKTLTLKLKLTTFEVRTRAVTLDRYIHTAEDILVAGLKLLRAELPVELRLMGLRMSHFYEEPKREPGQPSLEDVFNRRENKQQQQQLQQKEEKSKQQDEGSKIEQDNGVGADDGGVLLLVHTSQVLSAGDEVELTLRDWQDPSALVPASMPAKQPAKAVVAEQPITWACERCTFENPKRQLLCEMCGCSKTGTRPGGDYGAVVVGGGGQRRGKKRSQTATGTSSAATAVALNARIPAEMSENINELGLTESDQQAWMATNKQSHYTLFAAFLFFNILSYICGRVFAGRIDSPKLAAQAKHGIAQLCHATFAVSSAIYTLTHRPWVLGPGDCDPARLFCFDKLSSLYLDLHAGYLFYEWIFYLRSEAVLIPRFKYLGFHRTLLLLGYALAKVHPCILTVITLPFYQLLAVGQLAEARLDLAVAFRNLPRVCVDRLWYVVILAFFRAVGALTISFYSWWWISTRDLMHLDALRGKRTALNIAYSMLFVGGAFSLSLLYLNWFRAVGDSQKRVYAKITQAADRTSAGKVARETVNASSGTAKKKKKKKATRA